MGRSLPERRKHGLAVRFICGDSSVENQSGEREKKSFVCMRSRTCIIDIIIDFMVIIIILISSSLVDVSKLPSDGDFLRLVLLWLKDPREF